MTTPSPYNQEFPQKEMCRFFLGVDTEDAIGEVVNLTDKQSEKLNELIDSFKPSPKDRPFINSITIKKKR